MENSLMTLTYHVSDNDFTRAGEASSDVKNKLKKLGVPPDIVRKVAIAMYEGEINMVIHAGGGHVTATVTPSSGASSSLCTRVKSIWSSMPPEAT